MSRWDNPPPSPFQMWWYRRRRAIQVVASLALVVCLTLAAYTLATGGSGLPVAALLLNSMTAVGILFSTKAVRQYVDEQQGRVRNSDEAERG